MPSFIPYEILYTPKCHVHFFVGVFGSNEPDGTVTALAILTSGIKNIIANMFNIGCFFMSPVFFKPYFIDTAMALRYRFKPRKGRVSQHEK